MALYKYKAIDRVGKTVQGLVDAGSETLAIDVLRDKGLSIVSLNLESGGAVGGGQIMILDRVKPKDLVIFSRQFSVLISASVSMVQALKIMIEQTENMKLKMIVSEVTDEVDGGMPLSEALSKRPKVFNKFFVSVIKSGESSGKLDEVLDYLADEMEKEYDMLSKIKGAMIYPIFVLSGLLVVGFVMMVFVVPKLTAVIQESGQELPMATKIMIFVSDTLRHYWFIVIVGVIGLGTGLKVASKTPVGKQVLDTLVLKMPIFGKLFQRIYLVRFTRSLDTLLVGGVNLTKGLRITSEIVSNSIYADLIRRTIKEVEDGNSLSTVFSQSKEFPKMVTQMLSIGEKTGKIDVILKKITDFYSREIDNMVANLMTLMEPIIMVTMGIAVGIMVAAIIMPMYNMASAV